MTGKSKCSLLKSIRCRIARENNIAYSSPECTFQGACKGTCPKCEAELRYLTGELEKIKSSGKRVAVAGVAAMMAASAAGCASPQTEDPSLAIPDTEWTAFGPEEQPEIIVETELGEVISPEPEELDGDVAFPEEETYVTTGVIAVEQEVPDIDSVTQKTEEDALSALAGIPRADVQDKWKDYLLESGETEDIYEFMQMRLRLVFDEAGTLTAVELSEATAEEG